MLNILFVIIMWIFFVFIGLCLIDKLVSGTDMNLYLHLSSAFFVGGMYFLAVCRAFSAIFTNFRFGFFVCVLSGLIIIGIKRSIIKHFFYEKQIRKIILGYFIGSILICLITSFWCTCATKGNYDLNTFLGSANSGRYINLAYDISLRNHIPIVGQNYGESVLVACGLVLGIQRPFFTLNLWVDVTICSLLLFTYGIFIRFHMGKVKAAIATLVIAFANTALSFNYILIIDTGWPMIKNGYVDTHFGVASCVIIVFILWKMVLQKYKLSWEYFAVVICFGFAFNIIGAYIGFMVIIVLISFLGYNFKTYKNKGIVVAGICLAVSFIVGTYWGGVLTNTQRCESLPFEGMLNANGIIEETTSHIKIKPYLKYEVAMNGYEWMDISRTWGHVEQFQNEDNFFYNWFGIEKAFFEMLRLTFWPVIGTVLFGSYLWKCKKNDRNINLWVFVSVMTLIMGIGAAYGLEYGNKWWLTRIAAPGYYMGFICLMSYVFRKKDKQYQKYQTAGQVLVCFIMVFGPLVNIVLAVRNLMLANGGLMGCITLFADMYNLPPNIFY